MEVSANHVSLLPGGYDFQRSAPKCRRERARRSWGGRDLEEIVDIKASGSPILEARLVEKKCNEILNGVGNVYRWDG